VSFIFPLAEDKKKGFPYFGAVSAIENVKIGFFLKKIKIH